MNFKKIFTFLEQEKESEIDINRYIYKREKGKKSASAVRRNLRFNFFVEVLKRRK